MKTKGSFNYKRETENMILVLLGGSLMNTNTVVNELKQAGLSNIHHATVSRLLNALKVRDEVVCFKVGGQTIWQKK